MNYRLVEVGYKIVKLGKHAASCSLGALASGPAVLNATVLGGALVGGLAYFGSASAQQVPTPTLPNTIALQADVAGNIDGALGTGYLITPDSRFSSVSTVTIGSDDFQSLAHNFDTAGGAGSGGGAGLGGVFFVDQGGTLIINNTDFKSNRVQGGPGGSEPALRFYDRTLNVNGQSVNLQSTTITGAFDDLDYSNGSYSFGRLQIDPDAAGILYDDSRATFDGSTSASIASVTSNGKVSFSSDVQVASSNVVKLKEASANIATVTTNANAIEFDYLQTFTLSDPITDFGRESIYDSNTFQIGVQPVLKSSTAAVKAFSDSLAKLVVGSTVVGGSDTSDATRIAQTRTVESVEFYTQADDDFYNAGGALRGRVKSIVLDSAFTVAGLTTYDVLNAPSFEASQFSGSGDTITVTSPLGTYKAGMVLTWEDDDGTSFERTVISVVDEKTLVLDSALPTDVTGFEIVENPIVGTDQIRVANANSIFTENQIVMVPGADGVVFTGRVRLNTTTDPDVVQIDRISGDGPISDFYDPAIGLALKSSTTTVNNPQSITVKFDTSSMTDAELALLFNGRLIEGTTFEEGTTVTFVSSGVGTVTLSLSEAIIGTAVPEYFKLYSPLSTGGSMNNIAAPGNSNPLFDAFNNGSDGYDANWLNTFFNEGEGVDGTNGAGANDAIDGAGFNGGDGGNGSDGQPVNFWLLYDLATAIAGTVTAGMDISLAAAELAAAVTPDPVVGAATEIPDPVEIAAAALGLTKAQIDLVVAIADLTLATVNVGYWAAQLGQGLAGLGGAGGDGGEASGGTDFFGGGTGGAGGDGGDGAISISDGGDGGTGGRGGDGGFGAGGGQGGAGGDAGDNGNAAGGDPGDGGFAGFGAGEGANGNGMFGGGGSGLGGAIFVREAGTLLITGNSVFDLNYVAGGTTTSQAGEAGFGAGSDIFMMKGSNVRLEPGLGNEIRFEGDIADDSLATNDGFMNAAGDGADITIAGEGGLVVFNGENTYSGDTIIEGATLTAEVGVGVNDASLIRFNGGGISGILSTNTSALTLGTVGTFLLQDDYVRRAGTDPAETAWTGSGGFASSQVLGSTVTLGQLDEETGEGQSLVWGQDGFFVGAQGIQSALTFGSEQSLGDITFTNNVDLDGNIGRIAVYNTGLARTSRATLTGNWSDGTLLIGDAVSTSAYTGTLFLTGQNTLTNVGVAGGTVSTYGAAGTNGSLMSSTADITVFERGELHTFGSESAVNAFVNSSSASPGLWATAADITLSGTLTNSGVVGILGNQMSATNFGFNPETFVDQFFDLSYLDDDFDAWSGSLVAGGNITNVGLMYQFGTIDAQGTVTNSGNWSGIGILDVGQGLINTQTGLFNFDTNGTGRIDVAGYIDNAGNWVSKGTVSAGGALTNRASATMDTGTGSTVSAATVVNDGLWNILASQTLNVTAAGAAGLTGTGIFCLETEGDDDTICNDSPTLDDEGATATALTLNQLGDSEFGGVFTGLGSLSKTGGGELTLSAAQTFMGGLTVNAGALTTKQGSNAQFADTLNITVTSGAGLNLNTIDTILSLTNSGTVTANAAQSAGSMVNFTSGVINMNANLTTSSALGGNGSFVNNGTVTVVGTRTLDVAGLVGSGTIQLDGIDGGGDNDPSMDSDTLTLLQSGDSTYAGNFDVDNLTKAGDGTLTLTGGVNTVANFVIDDGMVIVGAGAGMAVSNDYTIDSPATLRIASDATVVASDVTVLLGGTLDVDSTFTTATLETRGVTDVGATLTVTDALNVYASGRVDARALVDASAAAATSMNGRWNVDGNQELRVSGLVGDGTFCIETLGSTATDCDGTSEGASATTLTLTQSTNSTFDGTFAGLGALAKFGTGALTLTDAQTFAGGLAVFQGAIVTATGTGTSATFNDTLAISVAPGATLDLNTVDTFGSLANSGTVNIDAAQTLGGASVTTGGTLNLNDNITTGGVFAVYDDVDSARDGTVNVNGDYTITANGGLAGTGDIIIDDAHNLTLSQPTNTFSTFRGNITSDLGANDPPNNANTSRFTLDGGGNLTLAGQSGQVSVAFLDIQNGTLSLDGNGLLDTNISVMVAGSNESGAGTLSIVNDDDGTTVRQEDIARLTGSGLISLGRNTLNVEEGGSFAGEVMGEGNMNIANGAFTISRTMTSTNGTLTVSNTQGTTIAPGTSVNVGTVHVATGASLNLAGSTIDPSVLNTNDLLVGNNSTLHLGSGSFAASLPSASQINASSVMINGTFSGSGTLTASSIMVTASSMQLPANVRPGDSPGIQVYNSDATVLGDNTILQIEVVDSTLAAGIGYDQVQFKDGGTVTLEGDIRLNVDDLANEGMIGFNTADNYVLGETLRFATFDQLAITGKFSSVQHSALTTTSNDFVVNLATGSLVGIGTRDLSDTATNANQEAMLSTLMVSDEGVAQYYGGRFIENLTAAWAQDEDLNIVFERASPEAYTGFGGGAQVSATGVLPDWKVPYMVSEGQKRSFVTASNELGGAERREGRHMRFGLENQGTTVGLATGIGKTTAVFGLGLTRSELSGDHLNSDGRGVALGFSATGPIPAVSGMFWTLGVSHASLDFEGTRVTNNGEVTFDEVGARAGQVNFGAEYHRVGAKVDLGLRMGLAIGRAISDPFDEVATADNLLDAMAVDQVKYDFTGLDLGMQVGTQVHETTRLFATLDSSLPINPEQVGVNSSYDAGQGLVAVQSRGLSAPQVAIGLGVESTIRDSGTLRLELGGTRDWRGDTVAKANVSARFDF